MSNTSNSLLGRPQSRALFGSGTALWAAPMIALSNAKVAHSAESPRGYVILNEELGVKAAHLLGDGTLEVTFVNGDVAIYETDDFVVVEDGVFAITEDSAAALAEFAFQGAGALLGLGAGIAGIAAVAVRDQTTNDTSEGGSSVTTITGNISGNVVEDSNGLATTILTTSGALSAVNSSNGVGFEARTVTATYGQFTLNADGIWSYEIPNGSNGNDLVQALGEGEQIIDSFVARTVDGVEQTVTVTVSGVNAGTGGQVELLELRHATDYSGFALEVPEYFFLADGREVHPYISGWSVSSAGDINNDGVDDLLMGAPYVDLYSMDGEMAYEYYQAGVTFVVYGKGDGAAVNMADVALGDGGFVLWGPHNSADFGWSVSSAGDVNGDGIDDFMVGSPLYSQPDPANQVTQHLAGRVYVVFGGETASTTTREDLDTGHGGGFVIQSYNYGVQAGWAVDSAGDVNGDGIDDLLISTKSDGNAADVAYVVFGQENIGDIVLTDVAAGVGGFSIDADVSISWSNSGWVLKSAGDVNGDGFADMVLGNSGDAINSGAPDGQAYVIFGKADGTTVQVSDLQAGNGGFALQNGPSRLGFSIDTVGDINGDGLSDIVVSAAEDSSRNGEVFVVFGKADGAAVNLQNIRDGIGGFYIEGEDDRFGYSVSGAGDVNGDGLDDFIVGSPKYDGAAGASYVIYGKHDGSPVDLAAVEKGVGGFIIKASGVYDRLGWTVNSAGDVNGDGFDDLVLGAPYVNYDTSKGFHHGEGYVIFGGDFSNITTELGTEANETFEGTATNDVIFAGAGDDIIVGNGGKDQLSGGAGADTFIVKDSSGKTYIRDFDLGDGDVLDLSDFGFSDLTDFRQHLSESAPGGHDAVFSYNGDRIVIFEGVKVDDLVSANLLLS